MLHAHGGDIYGAAVEAGGSPEEILDFSSNVNPRPVPETVREAIRIAADSLGRYPDSEARGLRRKAAEAFGVSVDSVLAGHGTTEFIYALPRRLRPHRSVILAPCYHDYWRAVEHARCDAEGVLASEANEFVPDLGELETRLSGVNMTFIGNPNNPTGVALSADSLRSLAGKFPSNLFVIDEALADMAPDSVGASLLAAPLPDNVVVLRSLSLFDGLPGLRVGFMLGHPDVCETVERAREPWTVGPLDQAAAIALLESETDASTIRTELMAERERVRDELSNASGLRVFRSQTNFLLLKITKPSITPSQLCERMLKQKMLIRNAAGFRGLDGKFVRVTIRGADDNARLVAGLRIALDDSSWR